MLIALVAICASAETYSYLKFTKTNGSTVTCSVEGLKITYDNTNVTVTNAEGTTTLALAEVRDMYFSNDGSTTPVYQLGDVNMDGDVNIADVTALIDKLLNNAEMIPEADCNQDTEMNIADVTALIDYLLNGAWPN